MIIDGGFSGAMNATPRQVSDALVVAGRLLDILSDPKAAREILKEAAVVEEKLNTAREALDAVKKDNNKRAAELKKIDEAYSVREKKIVEAETNYDKTMANINAQRQSIKTESEALAREREAFKEVQADTESKLSELLSARADVEEYRQKLDNEKVVLERDKQELQKRVDGFTNLRQEATQIMAKVK